MSDHSIFELGDVDLQCGLRLRGARLAYKTYGSLNEGKDNVIVFPTFFASQHSANEPMIGPGMALGVCLRKNVLNDNRLHES